jgi:hypothetical protein
MTENTTITLTSIIEPSIDSVEELYIEFRQSYEEGRWDGTEAVFILDDTAKNVVPW